MKKTLSILLLALIANNVSGALVSHTGKYFAVTEHDRSYRVGRESLDGTLRNVNKTNLVRFMQKGRISTHKLNDGSYMLRGHVNGLGGGPWGAWTGMWIGKFTTHFVAQAGISIATAGVAIVCPPAAMPFYMAAQSAVVPSVEVFSNVVALAGGIALGVATGPV
jgi:hypothetical protein